MNNKYIKGSILVGATLLLGLQSCQITNKYKAPEVDVENLYRDMNSTDTTTIANIPWREYFNDPYLQSLIEEGLDRNYDMQIALTRVDQAQAALSIAKAAYFPTVALAGQVTHSRYSPDGDFLKGKNTDYNLGLSTTWELDIWGKLNRQSKAKFADYLNSVEGQKLVQTNIVSGIATSYYTLLSLDEQLRLTHEAIALLDETVDIMESMKEAGMQNGAAVEQTKAALYNTQVTVPDLESNIRQLENSLSVMLGRKPGPISRSKFEAQSVPKELKAGLPVQMLANRPDVRSAELGFRSAFELANAAQASLYPSLSLSSGMIGFGTTNTLAGFFKPENILLNLVGNLVQPIFAGNQLRANLKVTKAQQQSALLTFEKTVLEASSEVSNILYTYESSLKKNGLRNKQIEALNNSVEFTQLLLKAGEANYLEVIQAEQDLLQAQIGQVNDKLEQLQATVDLYKALGGGIR